MDSKPRDETSAIEGSVTNSSAEATQYQDVERNAVDTVLYEKQEMEATVRDPDIVDWDGPDDPENPLNWSGRKKVVATATISLITLLTYAP